MWKSRVLFVVLVFHCVPHAVSIYEEQVGSVDWLKHFVGDVQLAVFNYAGRPALYVATGSDAVAQLNLRSGEVEWRKCLDQGDTVSRASLSLKEDKLITVSSSSKFLRAWRSVDGVLLWEQQLLPGGLKTPEPAQVVSVSLKGVEYFLILHKDTIKARHGENGKVVWESRLGALHEGGSYSVHVVEERDGAEVTLLKADAGGMVVHRSAVDVSNGEVGEAQQLEFPQAMAAQWLLLPGGTAVGLSQDGSLLCTASKSPAVRCSGLAELGVRGAARKLVALEQGAWFGVSTAEQGDALFTLGEDGGARLLLHTQEGEVLSSGATRAAGPPAVALVANSGSGVSIKVYGMDGAVLEEMTVPDMQEVAADGTPVPVARAFLGSYQRTGGGAGYRVVVVLGDSSLALVQQGSLVWRRSEGLAAITSALVMDLPPSSAPAEGEAALSQQGSNLWGRLEAQLLALKEQLQFADPEERLRLAQLRSLTSDKLRPTRDSNGFRKLIVVLTQSGSVFGLHNGDGHVMWEYRPPAGVRPRLLLDWASPHDLQHAPQLLLLQERGQGQGLVLDAYSGQAVLTLDLPPDATQVLELPQRLRLGAVEQHVFVLVRGSGEGAQVQPLPDTRDTRQLLSSFAPSLYYWEADEDSGVLSGYAVDGASLKSIQAWALAVASPPHSRILAITSPDPTNPIHSHTKVLGDRSLKVKYLSPNLVFVAVGPPDGQQADSLDRQQHTLSAWIVDSVTGRVLYAQRHQGAGGPVHAVLCEQWVVYHYRSSKHSQYEMSVVELYDDVSSNLTIADVIGGRHSNDTQSSYDDVELEVLSQSFFVGLPGVSAVSVSKTAQGIAQKALLLGTVTGQVYSMDKRLLDPRRPRRPNNQPTYEDREEGLQPYVEALPFLPTNFITYNRQVAGLRAIVTAPAALESTSLVFAYGLDLFYNRIAPSSSFDLLPPDFPYALLVAVTTAMTVLCWALGMAANQSKLKEKWA